jgi:hypothetical protein
VAHATEEKSVVPPCMVRLTRLPPSKQDLMLSTPLFLKIKNKIRAIKYQFREVFKALKK